ncbi:MAG: dihydropteroate synthase [Hydrogenophilales bacterium]|nr:dihydropteroate synthase [Hydrogenophilales bacterium]
MFRCGRFSFATDRPLVMGIVNVTTDSFSDGGRYVQAERAIEHGLKLREEGADLLDIGGESTRPGAQPVTAEIELERILPVIAGLRDCGAALSVDTMKPEVMRAVLATGADMINDVNALRAPGAWEAVTGSDCGLCLMHMQGEPRTMQADPRYQDVIAEIAGFLARGMAEARGRGIDTNRLLIDPGFGFGKTLAHNVALFREIPGFSRIAPVLVGVSRKSMLGLITGKPVEARMPASVAAALLAAQSGAAVLRVHDVAATVDALKVWQALCQGICDATLPRPAERREANKGGWV